MLSFVRENFLMRFEVDRVLSVRICYVDTSVAIAESWGYAMSLSKFFFREMDKSGYTHPFFRQSGGW